MLEPPDRLELIDEKFKCLQNALQRAQSRARQSEETLSAVAVELHQALARAVKAERTSFHSLTQAEAGLRTLTKLHKLEDDTEKSNRAASPPNHFAESAGFKPSAAGLAQLLLSPFPEFHESNRHLRECWDRSQSCHPFAWERPRCCMQIPESRGLSAQLIGLSTSSQLKEHLSPQDGVLLDLLQRHAEAASAVRAINALALPILSPGVSNSSEPDRVTNISQPSNSCSANADYRRINLSLQDVDWNIASAENKHASVQVEQHAGCLLEQSLVLSVQRLHNCQRELSQERQLRKECLAKSEKLERANQRLTEELRQLKAPSSGRRKQSAEGHHPFRRGGVVTAVRRLVSRGELSYFMELLQGILSRGCKALLKLISSWRQEEPWQMVILIHMVLSWQEMNV